MKDIGKFDADSLVKSRMKELIFCLLFLQVENWCPRLPWRAKNPNEETDQNSMVSGGVGHSLKSVLIKLMKPGIHNSQRGAGIGQDAFNGP